MKKFHIAISVADVEESVDDYSRRLGCPPSQVVAGEYALWRTETLNFSIRRAKEAPGTLRHVGWEDPAATAFCKETDVNGIVWEHFNAALQQKEIDELWPGTSERNPCGG